MTRKCRRAGSCPLALGALDGSSPRRSFSLRGSAMSEVVATLIWAAAVSGSFISLFFLAWGIERSVNALSKDQFVDKLLD